MHTHSQQLRITGLMGGHSGLNISEDRGNAVLLAAHILEAVFKAHPDCRLISLTAGDKRNAIAREASAVLLVSTTLVMCWSRSVCYMQLASNNLR